MLRVTLRQLAYFVSVAEVGSVAGAASRENVSQPSISSAILKMEELLGVDLFVRHHAQGVSVTPAGRRLLPHARSLIKHSEEFGLMAQRAANEPIGELKVGCYPTLAPMFVPPLVAKFAEAYPRVKLEFVEGTEEELLPMLARGEIELALLYSESLPETVKRIKVQDRRPYVLLPKSHPKAERDEILLSEMAREPFILFDTTPGRTYFLGLFAAAGVEPNIVHRSSSLEVVRGLVGRGLGYSVLATKPKSDLTYDGLRLRNRPLREPVRHASVCLVRMPTVRITRLGSVFQETCQSLFKRA